MAKPEYGGLMVELAAEYRRHAPASAALNESAVKHLVDGGSHSLRLLQLFPPRVVSARGAWVVDEDGHRILDFWQGHFANILGMMSSNSSALPGRDTGRFDDRRMASGGAPSGFGSRGWGDDQRLRPRD